MKIRISNKKDRGTTENTKIVISNIVGTFFIKGIALVVSFLNMPVYMRFFYDETVLGLWFTILSVLNWILSFDLGIGNGLRNHLARTYAERNMDEANRYLSSAYVSIGFMGVIIVLLAIPWMNFVNWNTIFNIDTSIVSKASLVLVVKITFVSIIVQLILKLISSVLYAMQKSSINNVISLVTAVLNLVIVLIIPSSSNDINMINMAIAHGIAVIVPLLIVTIIVFRKYKLFLSIHMCSFKHIKEVLSLGGVFFFIQMGYMVIMNTNDYLITYIVGSKYVVEYQIYYKIFCLGSTIFSLAMTPVWSVVTKAIVEKEYNWISNMYRKMINLAIVGMIGEFMLIPFVQIIINIWLHNRTIEVNNLYCICFSIMGSLMIFNSVFSSVANGMGALKVQTICFGIGAIIKAPLAYVMVMLTKSWVGVLMSNIMIMLIYCIIQPICMKKVLKKYE